MIDVGQNLCSVSCFPESYPALSRAARAYRAASGIVSYDAGKCMAQRIALALTYGKPTIASARQRTKVEPQLFCTTPSPVSPPKTETLPQISNIELPFTCKTAVLLSLLAAYTLLSILFRNPPSATQMAPDFKTVLLFVPIVPNPVFLSVPVPLKITPGPSRKVEIELTALSSSVAPAAALNVT